MIKLLYGSFYSYERLRFIGLNTQQILNIAADNDIIIKNAVRIDYAVMEADVYRVHVKKLKNLLGKNRYKIETIKKHGTSYSVTANKSRIFLWVTLPIAIIGLCLLLSRTWSIKVIGYDNIDAIKNIVIEKGMIDWRKNVYKRIDDVKKAISESDRDILWNSITINGTTVEVYIKKDTSVKVEEAQNGNLVSGKNCVIRNLIVTSGTAMAENGQTVSEGQVLIEASQKIGEAVFDVAAEGEAIASVWYYGSEEILTEKTALIETGNSVEFYEINLFGKKIQSKNAREYENYNDVHELVNTVFLPIKIEKVIRYEVKPEIQKTDIQQAIKEAEKEIINRLMIEIPEKAKLYETKTTTVEEDGIIKVSVYIETIENVAIRG